MPEPELNQPSPPQIVMASTPVSLAIPRMAMVDTYHRWFNDPATIHAMGNRFPHMVEPYRRSWEHRNNHPKTFEVVTTTDHTPVGITQLDTDDHVHTAEYLIFLDPDQRGHGYSTEATRLTLDWGFHVAALRSIWLTVLAPHTRAIASYTKAGFRHAGTRRQAGFWKGQTTDEIIMDATPEDFTGPSTLSV